MTRSDCVDRFGIGAADRADGEVPGGLAAGVADRAGLQPAGAERVEQAVDEAAVHLPLVRAVGVAEQRQRPDCGDDGLPARDDLVERLVPADRLELALALGADAPQRRRQPLGRVHQLDVAVDLGAGKAGGERTGPGSPWMRTTRPSSTWASSEHMSGQSWAHTTRIVCKSGLHGDAGEGIRGALCEKTNCSRKRYCPATARFVRVVSRGRHLPKFCHLNRVVISTGTSSRFRRFSHMPGWTPRQLIALWPVLAGSVVLGVLIALAS